MQATIFPALFVLTTTEWVASWKTEPSMSHAANIHTERTKRAGNIIGMTAFKAIQFLLRGAREVETAEKSKEFLKTGSYFQASREFIKTHPTSQRYVKLTDGTRGVVGKIGDRKILFRTSTEDGRPIIEIRTEGIGVDDGELTHKFIYSGKDD